jgi:hypothetical protein
MGVATVEKNGSEEATTADLKATSDDLMAAMDRLEAAIEAQTRRLTIRLGGILIAGMIATGFLLFASVPLLAP